MEPDRPISRVERTFWTVWSYITGALTRLFSPESTNQAQEHGVGSDLGHTEDDIHRGGVTDEQCKLTTASVVGSSGSGITWEVCNTDTALQPDEMREEPSNQSENEDTGAKQDEPNEESIKDSVEAVIPQEQQNIDEAISNFQVKEEEDDGKQYGNEPQDFKASHPLCRLEDEDHVVEACTTTDLHGEEEDSVHKEDAAAMGGTHVAENIDDMLQLAAENENSFSFSVGLAPGARSQLSVSEDKQDFAGDLMSSENLQHDESPTNSNKSSIFSSDELVGLGQDPVVADGRDKSDDHEEIQGASTVIGAEEGTTTQKENIEAAETAKKTTDEAPHEEDNDAPEHITCSEDIQQNAETELLDVAKDVEVETKINADQTEHHRIMIKEESDATASAVSSEERLVEMKLDQLDEPMFLIEDNKESDVGNAFTTTTVTETLEGSRAQGKNVPLHKHEGQSEIKIHEDRTLRPQGVATEPQEAVTDMAVMEHGIEEDSESETKMEILEMLEVAAEENPTTEAPIPSLAAETQQSSERAESWDEEMLSETVVVDETVTCQSGSSDPSFMSKEMTNYVSESEGAHAGEAQSSNDGNENVIDDQNLDLWKEAALSEDTDGVKAELLEWSEPGQQYEGQDEASAAKREEKEQLVESDSSGESGLASDTESSTELGCLEDSSKDWCAEEKVQIQVAVDLEVRTEQLEWSEPAQQTDVGMDASNEGRDETSSLKTDEKEQLLESDSSGTSGYNKSRIVPRDELVDLGQDHTMAERSEVLCDQSDGREEMEDESRVTEVEEGTPSQKENVKEVVETANKITEKCDVTTSDVSAEDRFTAINVDRAQDEKLSSEDIEDSRPTTTVTETPEDSRAQEGKNVPLQICEGQTVVHQELNSAACEETEEGVPEHNNKPRLSENTTQWFLEAGDYEEIQTTQVSEKLESKESESLQPTNEADDLLVRDHMEEERNAECVRTLQFTDKESPLEREKLVHDAPTQGSLLFFEDVAQFPSDSMKTGVQHSEEETETQEPVEETAKELQDRNEEPLVAFEIDGGLYKSTGGDAAQTVGDVQEKTRIEAAAGFSDETMKYTLDKVLQDLTESGFLMQSEIKIHEDRTLRPQGVATESQEVTTDVVKMDYGIEEDSESETKMEILEMPEVAGEENPTTEATVPSLETETQQSSERAESWDEEMLSETVVVDETVTCQSRSNDPSFMSKEMTNYVSESEGAHAGEAQSSNGGNENVIDDQILDLWLETALSEDTDGVKPELLEWSEPGQQSDGQDEASSAKREEKEQLVESESSGESGLASDTESSTELGCLEDSSKDWCAEEKVQIQVAVDLEVRTEQLEWSEPAQQTDVGIDASNEGRDETSLKTDEKEQLLESDSSGTSGYNKSRIVPRDELVDLGQDHMMAERSEVLCDQSDGREEMEDESRVTEVEEGTASQKENVKDVVETANKITEKCDETTSDVSAEDRFTAINVDIAQDEKLSSEDIGDSHPTTTVTETPEDSRAQEGKNVPLQICEGQTVVHQELNSAACEETEEGVPEHNNKPRLSENTTQWFLEAGDYEEIQTTQVSEKLESKESESLQPTNEADDLLVRDHMEEERNAECVRTLQFTDKESPLEREKLVHDAPTQGSLLFFEDVAQFPSDSMKTGVQHSEEETETQEPVEETAKELQDRNEEPLIAFEIDGGLYKSTGGDAAQTFGDVQEKTRIEAAAGFSDETMKYTLDKVLQDLTESGFLMQSEIKIHEDRTLRPQGVATESQEVTTDVVEMDYGIEEDSENETKMEMLEIPEVAAEENPTTEALVPSLETETQQTNERAESWDEEMLSETVVVDETVTCQSRSNDPSFMSKEMTNYVSESEGAHAGEAQSSNGGNENVIDDQIPDLWLETALSEDTDGVKPELLEWSEPGQQYEGQDETSAAKREEKEQLLASDSSGESGLASDTESSTELGCLEDSSKDWCAEEKVQIQVAVDLEVRTGQLEWSEPAQQTDMGIDASNEGRDETSSLKTDEKEQLLESDSSGTSGYNKSRIVPRDELVDLGQDHMMAERSEVLCDQSDGREEMEDESRVTEVEEGTASQKENVKEVVETANKITEKCDETTSDVSAEDRFTAINVDIAQDEKLSSEDIEDSRPTTTVTETPEDSRAQEGKNVPLQICEGQTVVHQELNSAACEETEEGVPEHNNKPRLSENTTQWFLEAGDYEEIQTTQVSEKLESKESESLQPTNEADDLLVRDHMEEERNAECVRTLHLTDKESPLKREELVHDAPTQGSLLFFEDVAQFPSDSMKTGVQHSEEETETQEPVEETAKELQDRNEELLVAFEIDGGLYKSTGGDAAQTVDNHHEKTRTEAAAGFSDETMKYTLDKVLQDLTESGFLLQSEIKIHKDRTLRPQGVATETQEVTTDVVEMDYGIEEDSESETKMEILETPEVAAEENPTTEAPVPSLETETQQSSERAESWDEEMLSETVVVNETVTCQSGSNDPSLMSNEMTNYVSESEGAHAGEAQSSNGGNENVTDDQILDLWKEAALSEDTDSVKPELLEWSEPGQQSDGQDEASAAKTEQLVESESSGESGLASDTESSTELGCLESDSGDEEKAEMQLSFDPEVKTEQKEADETHVKVERTQLQDETPVPDPSRETTCSDFGQICEKEENERVPIGGRSGSDSWFEEDSVLAQSADVESLQSFPAVDESQPEWSEGITESFPEPEKDEEAEQWRTKPDQDEVDAPPLDFTAQRSKIAVKNPHVRPPRNPRALLQMPSVCPTPSRPPVAKVPVGVRMGGLGIGIKLPGLGEGFPVLKKTPKRVRDENLDISLQETETKPEEKSDAPKEDEAPRKPKWMPPRHPGFGNPLLSELKTKLKKTTKE